MWVVWGRKGELPARPVLVTGRQEGRGRWHLLRTRSAVGLHQPFLLFPSDACWGSSHRACPRKGALAPLCLCPEHSLIWMLLLVPDSSSSSGEIVPHSGVNLRVKFTVDVTVLVKGVCPRAPGQPTGIPAPAPWGRVLTCSGKGVCVDITLNGYPAKDSKFFFVYLNYLFFICLY